VENRAMKQELVRTKSKISSLKREMSSIQQLHLAQQQVHAQLSAPSTIYPRQEHYHQHLLSTDQSSLPSLLPQPNDNLDQQMTINMKNLSTPSNDESLPPAPFNLSTNTTSSTQTIPSTSNDHQTRRSMSLTPSSIHFDLSTSPSDEQLRLYLTETLQREKDSDV
jgi:hypothetical protein